MMNGCIYRTQENRCEFFTNNGAGIVSYCDYEGCVDKHPSNADRIRAMTDEELADYIAWITRGNAGFSPVDYKDKYFPVWLDWLKQEVK